MFNRTVTLKIDGGISLEEQDKWRRHRRQNVQNKKAPNVAVCRQTLRL